MLLIEDSASKSQSHNAAFILCYNESSFGQPQHPVLWVVASWGPKLSRAATLEKICVFHFIHPTPNPRYIGIYHSRS